MPRSQPIRIANGQAFWGDSILGPIRLVQDGPLDYLTLDYLAEVTMSIMQKLKDRDPGKGYATDFIDLCRRIVPECQKKNVKIIANAGGVHPTACRAALVEVLRDLGLKGIRIGIVQGDNILPHLDSLIEQGESFLNLDSGSSLEAIRSRVKTANVYIGAGPIVEALQQDADIIIAGRVADPSLVLAPMMYEFGWQPDQFDLMAAGTVAGHIIECGTQCTGGNLVHWKEVPDMANIGYPIVEAHPDGTFVVTKHDRSGGCVNLETVTSQLVYEMGDPENFITPDCVVNFRSIQLESDGRDRVHVSSIQGRSPTDSYKVSIAYQDGFKLVGQLTVAGPEAVEKAQRCAELIFQRAAMDGVEFQDRDRRIEFLGASTCHAGIVDVPDELSEVVLRISARSDDPDKLNRLGREIVPVVTSGPPGVTGYAGGRPKAQEVMSFWPALISKDRVETSVSVEEI